MVPVNYEINVSKDGKHLFATAPRSITSKQKLKEMYKLFLIKFPPNEGYVLTLYGHVEYNEWITDTEAILRE